VRSGAGVTIFLVDAADAMVLRQSVATIAGDRQWDVFLNAVPVTPGDMIGEAGQGWPVAVDVVRWSACLWSAYMAGAADRVLSLTAAYARERQQFGKPIGRFQAIQHKLADMMVNVEGARLLAYEAAWLLDQGTAAEFEVAAAKAWCGDAFRAAAEDAMRIYASIGYAMECDIQLYYRRALSLKQWLGDTHAQRAKIADLVGI
jgi:alkylation response protein AidB-like acyl-CoA dehydrogenase